MATCPPNGIAQGDTTEFYAGPYNSSDVGSVSSYTMLDGKCTAHTYGYPYKATGTATALQSMLAFYDTNSSVDGLSSYEPGQILLMKINGIFKEWEIAQPPLDDSTIIVKDPDNYWPTATYEPGTDKLGGVYYFLEKQVQRNINITTGVDDSTGDELDGFTYTYNLVDQGQTEITAEQPLHKILDETFTLATGVFYIKITGVAPDTFQVGTSPPTEPAASQIYHARHDITTALPVVAGSSSGDGCVGLECDDPFAAAGGVVVERVCDDGLNLYNPYAQNKSVNLYKQLNNIVSNIFGHTVNYFRTEPNIRTADVTLMEYSLHKVADNQDIKILVPDNEFPEEANTFDIFGMEFAEFEVHIVHDRFKAVFGDGIRPRERDYMFIPIINKMYEVNSVSIADEFNATRSYWRLKLTKYQDRTSVIKTGFETVTDGLITGIDEVFGEEIADEQLKDTNPVQFQTISRVLEDGSRTYIDSNLTIVDEAIVNNFTTVSHNHYDLSKVVSGTTALRYATSSNMIIDGQIAISAWFRPTFEITDSNKYFLLSDQIASGGFDITINTLHIGVVIDGNEHKFTHNTSLSKTKWYGIVVNIMNNTEQVELMLYSLSVTGHVSSLVQEYHEVKPMSGGQTIWSGSSPYVLNGGKLNVTSLRIFDKAITTTEMKNILNQYVVHDNQHALVIDNAIPSLGYQRFKNAR